MSDINTTSINDLPTDPMGSNANNISITASEHISNSNTNSGQQSTLALDQSTISQIVNGLQQFD